MAVGNPLVFFTVAILAAAYWIYYEPLPDCYSDLQPSAKGYAQLRRNVNRLGIFLDSTGIYSLAGVLRAFLDYRTRGIDRSNTSEITTFDLKFEHIPVRIYLPPKRKQPGPGIIYIHGGGNVIGTLDAYDPLVRKIAIELEAVVMSVDYRLAPENKFPACLDDSELATRHFVQRASEWQVDTNKLVISGDSAGGHLSVATAVRLRDKPPQPTGKPVVPRALVLFYPFSQGANYSTQSWIINQHDPFLSREVALRYILMTAIGTQYFDTRTREDALQYMRSDCFAANGEFSARINRAFNSGQLFAVAPSGKHKRDTESPACPFTGARLQQLSDLLQVMLTNEFSILFNNLADLPATYVASAENDIIRDDSFMLVHRLQAANVPVVHSNFPKLFHGFMNLEPHETLQQARTFLHDTVGLYD